MVNSATDPLKRIVSIDVLRGVAVLGILIMNIQSFSMIGAAYINPTAYGDLSGINLWVWILSHVIASEKFMSIFSILFGAGILLLYDRIITKGGSPGIIHYRRNFWLLIFGLVHAYLIWYGDILVAYSLCAFLVYVFRKLKPLTLVYISLAFFIVPMLLYLFFGSTIAYWPEEAYRENMQSWLPSAENIAKELSAYRGSWMEQMEYRVKGSFFMQSFYFAIFSFWRVTSMMLLGMALYKWGILSAGKSSAFYVRMALISLFAGYALTIWGVYINFKTSWIMDYSMFIGNQFNYAGSVGVALGYIGLVMLICKSGFFPGVLNALSAVGRMAFTNYILMSLICTFIFYGHGFGLYGYLERSMQILVVFAVWVVIVAISVFWLKKYRYGPLEWLWRWLTYMKKP